jgi:hypothetical protein
MVRIYYHHDITIPPFDAPLLPGFLDGSPLYIKEKYRNTVKIVYRVQYTYSIYNTAGTGTGYSVGQKTGGSCFLIISY